MKKGGELGNVKERLAPNRGRRRLFMFARFTFPECVCPSALSRLAVSGLRDRNWAKPRKARIPVLRGVAARPPVLKGNIQSTSQHLRLRVDRQARR